MLEGLPERARRRVHERLGEGDSLAWCPTCARVGFADPTCSTCGSSTEAISVEAATAAAELEPGENPSWENEARGFTMHEQAKLDEAARDLVRMRSAQDRHDAVVFKDGLSAFTSAARSVLQYALKEARAKGSQAWYDTAIGAYPRIAFFKEERDLNIHERPVDPATATSVNILAPAAEAGAAVMAPPVSGGDTTVQPERATSSAASAPRQGRVEITTRFFLLKQKDGKWASGPEDAVTLAEAYLDDLRAVVADGRAKGVLTP